MLDTAAYCVKLTIYMHARSSKLVQGIARFVTFAKPAPPFVNGEQVARHQFRANDLHGETLNQSIVVCAAVSCFPLSFATESTVLKNMLFPVPKSIGFLLVFLIFSALQDVYLDRAIRRVSKIDVMFPYKGGRAFRNRLLDAYGASWFLHSALKLGFFFQELGVGNFQQGTSSR